MVTTSDDISNTLENSEVNSDVTDTDSAKIYVHTDEKTQIPPDGYIKVWHSNVLQHTPTASFCELNYLTS